MEVVGAPVSQIDLGVALEQSLKNGQQLVSLQNMANNNFRVRR